jgi:hypothetical protein
MKRAILAVILGLGVAVPMTRAAGTPQLRFDRTVHDFGTATEGDEVAGKFRFHNTGDAVLKVQTPETSCGCTVAHVEPDTLPPGESGEIAFTLDLTNARGAVTKTITIPSNDPRQSSVTLMITGSAKAVYDFSPQIVLFGDAVPGQPNQQTVEVHRLDGKPLQITKAELTKEFLKVTVIPETNSPPHAARLVIEARSASQPEEFTDILTVYMGHSPKPSFLIPVAGRVLGAVQLEPEVLVWKIPNPDRWPGTDTDTDTTRTLIVSTTQTNRPLDVGDFASSLDDLLVKVVELEKHKKFAVSVKLLKAPLRTTEGSLSFETSVTDQPSVTVPVLIEVGRP